MSIPAAAKMGNISAVLSMMNISDREEQALVIAPESKALVHVPGGRQTWSLAYRLGHHTDVLPFRQHVHIDALPSKESVSWHDITPYAG